MERDYTQKQADGQSHSRAHFHPKLLLYIKMKQRTDFLVVDDDGVCTWLVWHISS